MAAATDGEKLGGVVKPGRGKGWADGRLLPAVVNHVLPKLGLP